jgi:hypothetical protein
MITLIIKKIRLWVLLNFLIKIWSFYDKIEIKVVKNKENLYHICSRFRWKIYKEEGYIDPKDFPEQQLKDKYDKSSLNLLVLKEDIPIGTVRFILPSEFDLPTEKVFNIINMNFPKNEVGEISKLCIEKGYRKTKTGKKIFLMLMAEIYKFMKANKIKYALIGVPSRLKETFEKTDFQLSIEKLAIAPLTSENIEERKTAKKYFEKFKIIPYLITIT